MKEKTNYSQAFSFLPFGVDLLSIEGTLNACYHCTCRLKVLTHQCNSTMRQYGTLKKKELWYKKMLDIRYSNLQKAEAEVEISNHTMVLLFGFLLSFVG